MPSWYFALLGALACAALASFAGVVASRVPAGRSLGGRSECACGRPLSPWENVPVAGWLACAGTARCCGSRIPRWVVASEACAAAGGAAAGWTAGPGGVAAVVVAIAFVTAVATVRACRRH